MTESAGQLQDYSVDQLGGFVVMVAGAIGSLLLVVWQSKCHCKVNCCYLFQCERRPPSEEEMKGLKDQAQKLKDKKQEKKDNKDIEKGLAEDEPITLIPPRPAPTPGAVSEPEPEPQPIP